MADLSIIKKPWITEKATRMNELGKYTFIVKHKASKPEIKKAVKDAYKVDAVSVQIVNRPPKRKKVGGKRGVQEGYRKAIVTLKEGQKIDIQ